MKKTLFIFSILLLFIFGNSLILEKNAVGAIIDFETIPGSTPSDDLDITNQFASPGSGGVTFSTSSGIAPVLEQVGSLDSMMGFWNDKLGLEDTEATGVAPDTLGNYYLRLNSANLLSTPVPDLIIVYSNPVSAARAQIWDIDSAQSLGTEQWIVHALDANGTSFDSVTSDVGLDVSLNNSLDGKPWNWKFNHATNDIYGIQIEWVVSPGISKDSGIGLAFDNFNTNAVPIPGAIWLFGSGILGMVFIRRKRKN